MAHEKQAKILVADDERSIRWVLREALTSEGHQVYEATSGTEALDRLAKEAIDVALLDIRMPGLSGLDVISAAQKDNCASTFIVMTAQTTMNNAVEAMKRGAYDYVTKPFDLEVIRLLVGRALRARATTGQSDHAKEDQRKRFELGVEIVGRSPAMQTIYKLLGRVAKSEATVLVQGESGTGKELIAKAVHYHSPRWEGPFVAINCSAIPRDLLESELFGYERGAFTGATERSAGKFEQAKGGTLFLDEIGDMPVELQAKLLRVLQEREFVRVGGHETLRADMRVVAATNQNLASAVREGRFREDLYFRLNVVPIDVPPLRDRASDIPELIRYFLSKINEDQGTDKSGIAADAEAALVQHTWPGNVRELENTLVRAAVMSSERTLIRSDFSLTRDSATRARPDENLPDSVRARTLAHFDALGDRDPVDLYSTLLEEFERPLLEVAMERTGGNQVRAAQILGINRNTLRKKLLNLGLNPRNRSA